MGRVVRIIDLRRSQSEASAAVAAWAAANYLVLDPRTVRADDVDAYAAVAAARAAAQATGRADDDDFAALAAARAAGCASERAMRAAFPDDAATLVDARGRARSEARAARAVGIGADRVADAHGASVAALCAAAGDSATAAERVAATSDDFRAIYDAAIRADRAAAMPATVFGYAADVAPVKHAAPADQTIPSEVVYRAVFAADAAAVVVAYAFYGASYIVADFKAVKACCRKLRHGTEADARRARERDPESGVLLRVYRCDLGACDGWHLTSKL